MEEEKEIKYKFRKHEIVFNLLKNPTVLYQELEHIGMIDRMKQIPQLGNIRVRKAQNKSKYDYVMLQLYLLEMILNTELRSKLERSTGNTLKTINGTKYSIGDALQMLIILNGIGHFQTTFAGSKAVVKAAVVSSDFRTCFLNAVTNDTSRKIASTILKEQDYLHLHLLHALLVLEHCEASSQVQFAMQVLHGYLGEKNLFDEKKWEFLMQVFRIIRNITFNAMDLQIADLPYSINIENKKQMQRLLEEALSEYNDNMPTYNLIESVTKLLGDTLYHAPEQVIMQQMLTDKMVRQLARTDCSQDYYVDYFLSFDSAFHRSCSVNRHFDKQHVLKLTLPREAAEQLYRELDRIQYLRCGYYDRGKSEKTIIAAIASNAGDKAYTALRVLRTVIKHLRGLKEILPSNDTRYLLVTKFFITHLLHADGLKIEGTLDPERCVICTKGRKQRISKLPENVTGQHKNIVHEVDFLRQMLQDQSLNEVTITIPASIKTVHVNGDCKKEHEYDGMIIYPNRKEHQVVFLEAKNRKHNNGCQPAASCLMDKLNDAGLEYAADNIHTVNRDAYLYYTVPRNS